MSQENKFFKKLLSYMLQGILLLLPIAATLYVFYILFKTFDDAANNLLELIFEKRILGVGFIFMLVLITFIGYLSSLFIVQPLFKFINKLLMKTPGVKIIYSGLKDLMEALASDKRKFNKPVLINMNHNPLVQRMGFITQNDMSEFDLENKVAVYIPHSYNFSGNLYIVDAKEVTPLDIPSSDALKFMLSGGISEVEDE
jgi:uncharacterized membrane protein